MDDVWIHLKRPGVALALVAIAGLALVGFVTSTAADPTTSDIEGAVRHAIEDTLDAATFKSGWQGQTALDQGSVVAMHSVLDGRLRSHLSGNALASWGAKLHAAIDRESDGQHVIVVAGGVDQIQFSKVDVSGGTAVATGRSLDWIRWVQGSDQASPKAWDTFSARLVLTNGHWLVDDLIVHPEQSGP